jgi:hypothetical protein
VTGLQRAVVGLFEQLEQIANEHEELTDTDVREAMHLTLNCYFVWALDRSQFPRTFGMFSAEGDALVERALRQFLEIAEQSGELSRVPVGQVRLDILQADDIATKGGMQYDEFFGHRDTPLSPDPLPEYMFADGEYE